MENFVSGPDNVVSGQNVSSLAIARVRRITVLFCAFSCLSGEIVP